MSNCFLVMGLPRSGTSMVAGVLHNLGVWMGEEFVPHESANENGFFENLVLVRYHSTATQTNTFDQIIDVWDKVQTGEKYHLVSGQRSMYEFEIDNYDNNYLNWGFKDPRLCIPNLMENFISAAKKRHDIKIIFVSRHPSSVVKSLMSVMRSEKRNEAEIYKLVVLMQKNVQSRIMETGLPNIWFNYDNFIKNKYSCINKIMYFTKVGNYSDMKHAIQFVDSGLKRF